MSQEKPKERVKREKDHINPKVAGQDGSGVQFKIKRHAPLRKLIKASCQRQGLSMRQIRFRFDGQPVNETDAPAQLEMDDENTINVFQQQTEGWGCTCGQAHRQAGSDTEDIPQEDFALMQSAPPRRQSPASLGLSPGNFVWTHSCLAAPGGLFGSPGQDDHRHLLPT
ncbi:small ubiquitin-related modifier 3-like [Dama dama]|uniref:small ubiquitin-related modifier 3-like n=1 Tax=Dama dama TaxID=30532 RepID=UPI002A36B034|nr:small ubiquitin-related modifier 3-like [Dama dama]